MECVSDISTFNVWPQLRGQQTWVDVSCLEFTESVHDRGARKRAKKRSFKESAGAFSKHALSASCLLGGLEGLGSYAGNNHK